MKNKIALITIFLILFVVCLFALLPLFHVGFFTIHDDEQIGRLQQMFLVLSQGQIPPRWIPDLGFGYGYPLFNFYPPLVYYVGSLFHVIGFSYINATKMVIALGFLLSAATMYMWVKKQYGVIAGLFAAFLYTYAPYHSVDIYVRGALSEFFSWIFIPAIFWSMDQLFETNKKKYIVLFAIFYALLMLSHTLVMLQFAPIFGIYALFLLFSNRKDIKRKIISLSFALLLGLGLSAYFWLPSIAEKSYTMVDSILTTQLANYAIHFVCPIQLWSGPWGYGGSVAGCVDGLSFQLGKIQTIVAALGILFSFYYVKKKKNLPITVSAVFLFSLFMTLPYSKFIWDKVSPFWYIQFPWRYLLFTAVGSAFLGGVMISFVQKKFGIYSAIGIVLVLSGLAIFQVRNYFQPQKYLPVSDNYYTSKEALQWYVSHLSYEYVPKQVATRLSALDTTKLLIGKSDLPKQSYQPISGSITVHEEENIATLKKYAVTVYNTKTSKGAVLQINTYNFPGWQVMVDGKVVTSRIINPLDLIRFPLSEGNHVVTVQFVNTPIRLFANIVTILSLFTVVGLLFVKKFKKI